MLGETAESIEPPGICCDSQESSNLCEQKTCFSCNTIREANSHTVRGTLLIPCRTAMRGRFPLNGTYFQVNEVLQWREFSNASGESHDIMKDDTSVSRGFVCVRGFDRKTRAPRPLTARQHLPASKLVRLKRENSKVGSAEDATTKSKIGFSMESQDG
ncbi:hypothetical protein ACLOJK_020758 [Asimina triloba]